MIDTPYVEPRMYTLIDVVSDAEMRAEATAFDDRMRYARFVELAENFAATHGLVVGGNTATRLLLAGPDSPAPVALDSFSYDFYSGDAPAHARALGKAIWASDPNGLGHYTTVLTNVPNYRLSVVVDGRNLFTITALPVHKGVRTVDVLNLVRRPAQLAKDGAGKPVQLLCAGPDIQLMDIYRTLCNPAESSSWTTAIAEEANIRKLLSDAEIAGGRDQRSASRPHSKLRDELLAKFAPGPSRVLVGPVAIAILTGAADRRSHRLQIVTAGRLEAEAGVAAAIATTLGITTAWSINDPKIPGDPRLRRLTLHAVTAGRREPVLDIYNAAAHELIPYTSRGKLRVGTPFVQMRFHLAEIWTIQVLRRMDVLTAGYARGRLREMLSEFGSVAKYYEGVLASAEKDPEKAADRIVPTSMYIGRLEDANIALRRAAMKSGRRRFPFMPAAVKKADRT